MEEITKMMCADCGRIFIEAITPDTREVHCPDCGGYHILEWIK